MSSDLRRPSDQPRPPDASPNESTDRPPYLRDGYVDDPNDIFRTTDALAGHRNSTDGSQYTEQRFVDDADAAPRVDLDDNGKVDKDVDEPFEFDPRRAGLDDMTGEEATAFIAANKGRIPWLTAAEGQHPQVQRVYAALETGRGHLTPRHDDYGDDEMYRRRVLYLEDPAQLDDAKRAARIDAFKSGDKKHYCAEYATRVHDAIAFATAFAHGIEHPEVRAALDKKFDPKDPPDSVRIPISSLLGENGHLNCSGFRLVGDDPDQTRQDRKDWLAGGRQGRAPEPQAESIPTFENGVFEFRFGVNRTGDGYEVLTMFPDLYRDQEDEGEN